MNWTSRVELEDGKLAVRFLYDPELVAWVKGLEGRKWVSKTKTWTALLSVENIDMLRQKGFSVGQDVNAWYERFTADQVELDIPGLKGELFPFQKRGVQFLEEHNGRALIADEMGLGKTIQTLAWLQLHKELWPVVIVVPASVKLNWKREIEKWMDDPRPAIAEHRSGILQDMSYGYIHACQTRYIVINYDILDAWVESLGWLHPKVVILDECHYIKSSKAKRTKAVRKLCKKVHHVIALSGTPIINRPVEIYNTLSLLQRDLFPNWWKYVERYCDLKAGRYGWSYQGASHTDELHDRLVKTVMIRRLKKDVLPELPDKVRTVIPLELDNRAEYDEAEDDFVSWLRGFDSEKAKRASNAEALARIEGLKQLTIKGKMDQCIKWIADFLESSEKLVVFCTHRRTVAAIQVAFVTSATMVYGGQTAKDRQYAIDRFQTNPECQLIICNIKAGGVGINLHAASNVAFVELPWTSGDCDQAEDRVHRIGQHASSVNAWYLLAANTIEEEIAALLDKKRAVLTQVLDGKDVDEQSLLTELLDKYKKEK